MHPDRRPARVVVRGNARSTGAGVRVGQHPRFVAEVKRPENGRVHAGVSCQARDQHPMGSHPAEDAVQLGMREGIALRLPDDGVAIVRRDGRDDVAQRVPVSEAALALLDVDNGNAGCTRFCKHGHEAADQIRAVRGEEAERGDVRVLDVDNKQRGRAALNKPIRTNNTNRGLAIRSPSSRRVRLDSPAPRGHSPCSGGGLVTAAAHRAMCGQRPSQPVRPRSAPRDVSIQRYSSKAVSACTARSARAISEARASSPGGTGTVALAGPLPPSIPSEYEMLSSGVPPGAIPQSLMCAPRRVHA
jgi:hypothetical protein